MKLIEKGEGDSDYVVIGSIHGDEPAGKKAIERFLEEEWEFSRPVRFIIANEEALEKDTRFIDSDINSSFPGDKDSESHEERLASEIHELIEGKTVLDLHTTRSCHRPFATIKNTEEETRELLRASDVKDAVLFPADSGTLIESSGRGIVVETGEQGTEEAAENALKTIKNFLGYFEVIDYQNETSEPDIFRYYDTVDGDWDFQAMNFKKVEQGLVCATRGEEELRAEEDFYPVLMSTEGYEGKLGYKAKKISER